MLTWLYVPGDRPDRFAKAVASGADVVILDLEDAVALPRKEFARAAVAEFLAHRQTVSVQVRVASDVDIAAVVGKPGLAGLRLPKVESAADVHRVAGLAPGVDLHPLVESALGVEAAYAIAGAHPQVASIGLGEADLVSDLGVSDEDGLAWARSRIVVAARAAGLPPPAMSVYAHVHDLDGLAASCETGRRLGFLGRAAIHPRQLAVIVAAFRPTETEVGQARTLLDGLAAAQANGSGGTVLPDGRFADVAMVAAAERTLALAEQYASIPSTRG